MTNVDQDAAVEACLELIRRQRLGVSFAELSTTCEFLGVPTAGDETVWGAAIPNVALWAGMSNEFAAVCQRLYEHPDVVLVACSAPVLDAGRGVTPPAIAGIPRAGAPRPTRPATRPKAGQAR